MSSKSILVLGAHPDSSRFACKAMKLLKSKGFDSVPINPRFAEVLGHRCYSSVSQWMTETGEKSADTVTFYLNPAHSTKLQDELLALKPRRAIFNPGAENPELERALKSIGVEVHENCTLVMLNTGRF